MIRIAVVEDEDRAARTIEEYLERFFAEREEPYSVTRFTDPVGFLDHYTGYELVLMDIEMPNMNGMEGARKLRTIDSRVRLVFVTNLARFAAKGYEVEAMDFIIKPVAYSDFSFKMKRVMNAIRMDRRMELMIPVTGGVVRAGVDDLLYVEIRGHTLSYHFTDRVIETRGTMEKAEAQLSGASFLRPHNGFLVNPRYIDSVQGYTVTVGGEELMISHPRRKEFMQQLSGWYAKGGQ